jgi:hypothetical protein
MYNMRLANFGERLGEIAKQRVRPYSTFDFGRNRDESTLSVVVPQNTAEGIVYAARQILPTGLLTFMGTTQWLGEERHEGGAEIVIACGATQFDSLRLARSDAINYGMDTEDLVRKLQSYDSAYGIDIFHAETDTIEFKFNRLPESLSSFCAELYKFCPDIVDQGVGTVEALADEIHFRGGVFLWWD